VPVERFFSSLKRGRGKQRATSLSTHYYHPFLSSLLSNMKITAITLALPALVGLASAQNGLSSFISDITSVGGDITSVGGGSEFKIYDRRVHPLM
jgi:hypothetical protein